MYVYLRAVRGNTGVEKEETLHPLRPSPGLVLPLPASPLILFSLTVPVVFLSPSTPCSSAIRFIFSLPPSVSLSVSELSFSYHSLISLLSLTLSFLSVFLSSSFIRDYASRIACRNMPICCCYYVVAADETLRCTRICARKKRTPVCRT